MAERQNKIQFGYKPQESIRLLTEYDKRRNVIKYIENDLLVLPSIVLSGVHFQLVRFLVLLLILK